MSTYQYIALCQAQVPVRRLYQVLQVAPSAYSAWHQQRERAGTAAVREAFSRHNQRYGTRRLLAEVQAEGHAVGRWRIRRVLKAHGQPAPTAPNRVWVGDI